MKSFLELMDIIEEGSRKEELELERLMIAAGFVLDTSKKGAENWWEKEVEGLGMVGVSVSKQPKIPARKMFKTAMSNWLRNINRDRELQQKRAEEEAAKRKNLT